MMAQRGEKDTSYFPYLVDKYVEIFCPAGAAPGRNLIIDRNVPTLKSILEEDEKQRIDFFLKNRPSSIFNVIGCDAASFTNLFVGGTALFLESTQGFLLNFAKPQRRIVKLMEEMGCASRNILEAISWMRVAFEAEGYLPATPWLMGLIALCHQSMDEITTLISTQMNWIDRAFYIDNKLISNSFSKLADANERFNVDFRAEHVWPSEVDILMEGFEIIHSNIVEYIFRLLLARRDPDYLKDITFHNLHLENIIIAAERIALNLRTALQECKENYGIEAEDVTIIVADEPKIDVATRFSREYQLHTQTLQLRKRLREMDNVLAELENKGRNLVSNKAALTAESSEFSSFVNRRPELENLLNSLTMELNRYLCYIDISKKNLEHNKKLSAFPEPNDEDTLTKINDSEVARPLSPLEAVGYQNLTYEPSDPAHADEDEEINDEFFYGHGNLGDQHVGETDGERPSEKAVAFLYGAVLSELKTSLIERKEKMASRELAALQKTREESPSGSDQYERMENQINPGSLPEDVEKLTLKTRADLNWRPEPLSTEMSTSLTQNSGLSLHGELLQAIKTRAALRSAETYE